MKRFLVTLATLATVAAVAALSGCATGGPQAAGNNVLLQLDDAATGSLQTRPAVLERKGQPAVLYATQDNRVVFKLGDKRQELDVTAPVKGGNRFQLNEQDQHLHALWWSHQDAKNLYFSSSADGGQTFAPVSIVNDAHGVLAPFSLLRGPGGVVGMVYSDERLPRYQAYFNRSTDYGRTWARPDVRLDLPNGAISTDVGEPQGVESGKAWVTAWVDAIKESGRFSYRILSRRSDDAGVTWSPQNVVFTTDKLISSLKVGVQGSHIVLAFDESQHGIVAFSSADEGRNWRSAGAMAGTSVTPGTDGASSSGIELAVTAGRAHVSWMQDRKDEKTRIMYGTLDLAQGQWLGAARRLDTKAFDNTRSMLPSLLVLPDGPVLASWLDYRDIRPNIYMSASFDQGKSWSAPQPYLKPGEVSAGWPKLMAWGKQAAIGYDIYPDEQVLKGKYLLKLLPLDASAKALPQYVAPVVVSDAERKARLEQRVKTNWDYRVAGNFASSYDMFDFAFRAASTKAVYVEGTGVINFLSYGQEGITIKGNEAEVKMKIKYEVKSTMMPNGKLLKVEPVDVEAVNTWVWVDNDWYMVYAPSFGQANLQY